MQRSGVCCSPGYGWELGTPAGIHNQLWPDPVPTRAHRHGREHGELCFLTARALRKGPVDSKPGSCRGVLGAWEDGKRIAKLYARPHDSSHRRIALLPFFSTKKAEERKNHPWLSRSPSMGPCCRKRTCQMPAIGLQSSIIFSLLLLEVLPPLPPWMLPVACGNKLCTQKGRVDPRRGSKEEYGLFSCLNVLSVAMLQFVWFTFIHLRGYNLHLSLGCS